ncbi:MAG: amino acid kinase family protein [Dehalococcoidia bacterium]
MECPYLTDVDGIRNGSGQTVATLNLAEARDMLASGIASKGMIPKMEASLRALTTTKVVRIIDGRVAQALRGDLAGQDGQTKLGGTTIGTE